MRRALSALIMGVSLLVASATWAGFILSHTVLDPGRSERLADHLLDDPAVRNVIINRLADAIEASIPTEVPVGRDTIELAAATAIDDPRVEALIRDGIVRSHQNALNGIDEPVILDASALGAAGRDAVVALNPELDAVLPAAPPLPVELPNTGLSWLGDLKTQIDRFTRLGTIVSLIGIATGFVLSRNRPKTLRRVAYWAIGASAFWLATGYAIPWLLEQIAPSTVSIASAAVDVFFGAMVPPALTMAGIGVGLLVASLIWPSFSQRWPAAMLDRAAGGSSGRAGRVSHPVPNGWQPESGAGGPMPAGHNHMGPGATATPTATIPYGAAPLGANRAVPGPYQQGPGSPAHRPAPAPGRTESFPVIQSRFDEPGPDRLQANRNAPAPAGDFTTPAEDPRTSRLPGNPPGEGATVAAPGGAEPQWHEGVGYLEPAGPEDDTLNAPWPRGPRE